MFRAFVTDPVNREVKIKAADQTTPAYENSSFGNIVIGFNGGGIDLHRKMELSLNYNIKKVLPHINTTLAYKTIHSEIDEASIKVLAAESKADAILLVRVVQTEKTKGPTETFATNSYGSFQSTTYSSTSLWVRFGATLIDSKNFKIVWSGEAEATVQTAREITGLYPAASKAIVDKLVATGLLGKLY